MKQIPSVEVLWGSLLHSHESHTWRSIEIKDLLHSQVPKKEGWQPIARLSSAGRKMGLERMVG